MFDPLGDEPEMKPRLVFSAKPCTIRIAARTITVDGDLAMRSDVVARCKDRGMALIDLAVTADRDESWTLQAELDAAGVPILLRNRSQSCEGNPLAKGCT
jgi:hypothetical protein